MLMKFPTNRCHLWRQLSLKIIITIIITIIIRKSLIKSRVGPHIIAGKSALIIKPPCHLGLVCACARKSSDDRVFCGSTMPLCVSSFMYLFMATASPELSVSNAIRQHSSSLILMSPVCNCLPLAGPIYRKDVGRVLAPRRS